MPAVSIDRAERPPGSSRPPSPVGRDAGEEVLRRAAKGHLVTTVVNPATDAPVQAGCFASGCRGVPSRRLGRRRPAVRRLRRRLTSAPEGTSATGRGRSDARADQGSGRIRLASSESRAAGPMIAGCALRRLMATSKRSNSRAEPRWDGLEEYGIVDGDAAGLLVLHGLTMNARDTARGGAPARQRRHPRGRSTNPSGDRTRCPGGMGEGRPGRSRNDALIAAVPDLRSVLMHTDRPTKWRRPAGR